MKRPCLSVSMLLAPLAACETDPSIDAAIRVCVASIPGSGRAYLQENADEIVGQVSNRSVFILRDSAADSATIARESPSGECGSNERTLTGDEWRDEISTRSASNLRTDQSCAFYHLDASNEQMMDLLYDITLSGVGGSAYSGVDGNYSLNVQSDCELAEPYVRAFLGRRAITGATAAP